jgi:putative transposase
MSRSLSPVTGKPHGFATVCRVWRLARSGVYRHLSTSTHPTAQRRGPLGAMSDEALTTAIQGVLAASPFQGEGHRKVWARLRHAGTRTSLRRVPRLMRQSNRLAARRAEWNCREFRAGLGMIGAKEPTHAASQRPSYP